MSKNLTVGVEVKKGEEEGLFVKESSCESVEVLMNDENEIGIEVRNNHAKMREFGVTVTTSRFLTLGNS